jgi:hypothetical protein
MLKSSHSDADSKRKMVDILRRCNLAEDDDGGDAQGARNLEFLGSVLESVDLRDTGYEELRPEQQAAFRQAVAQGRLDHLIDVWAPWWIAAPLTGLCAQPSPAHVQPIPPMSSLCTAPPSPSVGHVLVACVCCYAVLMRVWNGEPDACMAHSLLASCRMLSKQDPANLQLQSTHSLLNECFSRLCDAAVGLSRAAIPAAIADLLCIFASRHFILSALSVCPPLPPSFMFPFAVACLHFAHCRWRLSGRAPLAAAQHAAERRRLRLPKSCVFAVVCFGPLRGGGERACGAHSKLRRSFCQSKRGAGSEEQGK